MNKSVLISAFSSVAAALVAVAAPSVGDVALVQDAVTRRVTVSYTLADEPAVVTLDIQTNGVSIGAAHVTGVFGDVNALVQPTGEGEVRRIWWQPDVSWAFNRVTDGSLKAVVTAWPTNDPPDYIVYDLAVPGAREFYVSADQIPGGVSAKVYKTEKLVMRRIPAAGVRWRMGSPKGETGRGNNEVPHFVTLSRDYYMAIYPFTQGQYKMLTGSAQNSYSASRSVSDVLERPCEGHSGKTYSLNYNNVRGGNWPTEDVAANTVIDKLRVCTGQDTFDLPTEARWEFACRAGTSGALNSGKLNSLENYDRLGFRNATGIEGDSTVQPVGRLEPNAWGLYDMHGNIIEFCLDWYQEDLSTLPELDPVGPATNADNMRAVRGGGMGGGWNNCRSASRSSVIVGQGSLQTGFRVVCETIVK